MTSRANAQFSVKSWEETTWDGQPSKDVSGAKQTHAIVTYVYHGDMEGESITHYFMNYNADGSGTFVAMERFVGSFAGRSGSFVIQQVGSFEPVKADATILPGSGTGDLAGLHGEAHNELVGHRDSYPITFDYAFE